MSSSVYSLWLQPSGDIAYRLKERINAMSQQYGTPSFAPHITLLGGLKSSETELISLTNTLVSSLSPFEVTLKETGYSDRFYQSLFLRAEKSSVLEGVRKRACRLFDISDAEDYHPHLSLLYGDLSQKEKERILNVMGRAFYIRFPVKSIVLMQTEGSPEQWKKIDTAVF